jgi:hypothetical protein
MPKKAVQTIGEHLGKQQFMQRLADTAAEATIRPGEPGLLRMLGEIVKGVLGQQETHPEDRTTESLR